MAAAKIFLLNTLVEQLAWKFNSLHSNYSLPNCIFLLKIKPGPENHQNRGPVISPFQMDSRTVPASNLSIKQAGIFRHHLVWQKGLFQKQELV